MMAQSWCTMDEPLRRPLTNSNFHDQLQQQPYETVIEDDDLFNVALLFLDTHDDSHSDCSESFSPQAPDDMPTSPTHWLPAKSFQDQLAEVALHSPLEYKLHEHAQSPSVFVDTTGSLAFQANKSQVWSPSQTKPSTPPRRINKRRLEIERLREESLVLQKRLLSLQDHSTKLTSTDAKYGSVNNRPVGEVLGSAWQNIATRQLEQRQRSESENLRLKNVVNEHKRMAKALRRLVARHANAKAWDPLRPNTREPATSTMQARVGSFDAMDDPAVFKELRETLATMYLQTDEIVAKSGLAPTEGAPFSGISSKIDGDHTLRVQVLGSRTLPFSYASTSETVWDYTLHHSGPKVMQWEPTESPDTFQTDFVAYTEMYHFKGLGRAKVMLRRIDEPHRVVILRSGLFQCPGADDHIPGPQRLMRHCMWDIIQKTSAAVDTKHDLSGMCQLISCELIMPTLELDGLNEEAQERQIETLTSMCTHISSFHAKEANEFIDNSLLQRAVKSPRDVEAVASRLTAVPDVYC